jgi:hypothetical protein
MKIRQLKYKENMVYNNDNNKTCNLIQKKYTIDDMLVSSYQDKIISYDIGFTTSNLKKKKKSEFIIESDSEKDGQEEEGQEQEGQEQEQKQKQKESGNISIKIQQPKPKEQIQPDEPIIGQGKDGIAWNNPKYQEIWDALPPKLKTELKVNIEWMKAFMNKCVVNRESGESCDLSTPPNLIVPPRKMENGQYDFGVSIYNKVFNSQSKTLQDTYLTLYNEDPQTKVKNYKMLEDAMNQLVKNEVGFGRGFF